MKTSEIDWNLPPYQAFKITAIVERADKFMARPMSDRIDLEMSLIACHKYACKLDLSKLLNASDETFLYDLRGIEKHLCRETVELKDCFLPRCAA